MWRLSPACFVLSLGGLKMGRLAPEANFSFGNSLAEGGPVKVYQKCACRERVDFRPESLETVDT